MNLNTLDITSGGSFLPFHNLGNIAYYLGYHKESRILNETSLFVIEECWPEHDLKYKIHSQLAMGMDYNSMRDLFGKLIKRLRNNNFMKVIVLRDYGNALQNYEEFKLEGKNYLKQADELGKNFLCYSEKELSIFFQWEFNVS